MVLKYDTKNLSLDLNIHKCVGCLVCIDVCPHNVFKSAKTKIEIVRREQCIECGACAKNCPTAALTVNSGVGCAQAFINSYFNGGDVSCDCDCGPKEKKKSNCC